MEAGRREIPQRAEPERQSDRGRAGHEPGPCGPEAGRAQNSGNRRELRARQLRPRRNRRNYPRLFRRRGQDGAPRGDPGGAPRRDLVRRESMDSAPAEQKARI